MRRWEKVLFARRYRSLSEAIEAARARLHEARTNEAAASARLAEVENELGRIRIELASADAAATQAREAVHSQELEINRRQQQIALDTQQFLAFVQNTQPTRRPSSSSMETTRPDSNKISVTSACLMYRFGVSSSTRRMIVR